MVVGCHSQFIDKKCHFRRKYSRLIIYCCHFIVPITRSKNMCFCLQHFVYSGNQVSSSFISTYFTINNPHLWRSSLQFYSKKILLGISALEIRINTHISIFNTIKFIFTNRKWTRDSDFLEGCFRIKVMYDSYMVLMIAIMHLYH